MSDDKLEKLIEDLRTWATEPLDLDQLVKDGVLVRRSKRWYKILRMSDLPEHVGRLADLKIQGDDVLFKFPSQEKARKLYRKFTGRWPGQ